MSGKLIVLTSHVMSRHWIKVLSPLPSLISLIKEVHPLPLIQGNFETELMAKIKLILLLTQELCKSQQTEWISRHGLVSPFISQIFWNLGVRPLSHTYRFRKTASLHGGWKFHACKQMGYRWQKEAKKGERNLICKMLKYSSRLSGRWWAKKLPSNLEKCSPESRTFSFNQKKRITASIKNIHSNEKLKFLFCCVCFDSWIMDFFWLYRTLLFIVQTACNRGQRERIL